MILDQILTATWQLIKMGVSFAILLIVINFIKTYIANLIGEKKEECWYIEKWYKEDLAAVLEDVGIRATEGNIKKLEKECRGLFDDKTERNEMLADKAREAWNL